MKEYICPHCKGTFKQFPSRIKRGQKYCSHKCYNNARRDPSAFCVCELCGKDFITNSAYVKRRPNHKRFCSVDCSVEYKRRGFGVRTGKVGADGYEAMTDNNGNQVRVHRYLMEQSIGRKLRADQHVHHINGNKLDNRLSNLEVLDSGKHTQIHAKKRYSIYWSEIPINHVLKLFYVEGIGKVAISRELNIDRHTVSRWLKETKPGGKLSKYVNPSYKRYCI